MASTPRWHGARTLEDEEHVRDDSLRCLLLLLPSQFAFWCVSIGPMAFVQHTLKDRHGDTADLYWTYALSIRGVLSCITGPYLGAMSDRVGRRPIYLYSILMSGLTYIPLATGYSWSIDVAVIWMAIAGLAGSSFAIPFAFCSDITPDKEKLSGTTALLLSTSFTPAFVLAPQVVSLLFKHLDKTLVWRLVAATVGCNLLYTLLACPETAGFSSKQPLSPRTKLQLNPLHGFRLLFTGNTLLRRIAAVLFFLYFAKNTVISIIVLFVEQIFDWTAPRASWLLTTWGISQCASMALLAFLKRLPGLDERKVAWLGLWSGLVGMMLFFVTTRSHEWLLYVAMAVGAVSMISLAALTSCAAGMVDEDCQGEVQGLMTTMVSLTEILGPLCFGTMLKECSKSSLWYINNLPFLVGIISCLVSMAFFMGFPETRATAQLQSPDGLDQDVIKRLHEPICPEKPDDVSDCEDA